MAYEGCLPWPPECGRPGQKARVRGTRQAMAYPGRLPLPPGVWEARRLEPRLRQEESRGVRAPGVGPGLGGSGGQTLPVQAGVLEIARVFKWQVEDQRWLEWSNGEWRIRGG